MPKIQDLAGPFAWTFSAAVHFPSRLTRCQRLPAY